MMTTLNHTVDREVIYDDDYAQSHGGSRDGQVTEEGCVRYVLWAAYVDMGYEGGGIGEYMYWNREENKWDDSACYIGGGGSKDNNNGDDGYKTRCAKMDCHLEDTHFSVLGKSFVLVLTMFIVYCQHALISYFCLTPSNNSHQDSSNPSTTMIGWNNSSNTRGCVSGLMKNTPS